MGQMYRVSWALSAGLVTGVGDKCITCIILYESLIYVTKPPTHTPTNQTCPMCMHVRIIFVKGRLMDGGQTRACDRVNSTLFNTTIAVI